MSLAERFRECLSKELIAPVVPFEKNVDKVVNLDLSNTNSALTTELLSDTSRFTFWIENHLNQNGARYGIGGYNELRVIYSRSNHFSTDDEPRQLHLGVDIWAPSGTPVYSPLKATVHSFNFNNNFGDYGATIILKHQLEELKFYSIYGHLSLDSINTLNAGKQFSASQEIAKLGNQDENGNWPPHLHFQLIFDLQNMKGDYPGVCKFSEKDFYLANCPNPDIILKYTFQ